MARTPTQQPVVADKSWVDVYYLGGFGFIPQSNLGILTCAVRREGDFYTTNERITREGIYGLTHDGKNYYIPPSAILKITDRE